MRVPVGITRYVHSSVASRKFGRERGTVPVPAKHLPNQGYAIVGSSCKHGSENKPATCSSPMATEFLVTSVVVHVTLLGWAATTGHEPITKSSTDRAFD